LLAYADKMGKVYVNNFTDATTMLPISSWKLLSQPTPVPSGGWTRVLLSFGKIVSAVSDDLLVVYQNPDDKKQVIHVYSQVMSGTPMLEIELSSSLTASITNQMTQMELIDAVAVGDLDDNKLDDVVYAAGSSIYHVRNFVHPASMKYYFLKAPMQNSATLTAPNAKINSLAVGKVNPVGLTGFNDIVAASALDQSIHVFINQAP
jgi:hypothetical protein